MDLRKMDNKFQQNKGCGLDKDSGCACSSRKEIGLQPLFTDTKRDEVCCGSPPGPESNLFERPGYALLRFVEDFVDTPIGPVPRVKTSLDWRDLLGKVAVRWAINRSNYKVAPGLYCVGVPERDSPVLVTANYKLTFDLLRTESASISAWIIVLDTRGINVWCAAGKNLFSTSEVVRRVKLTGLEEIVRHRELILPQLAATGVSAHQVKKDSDFKVVWGPIRAKDIKSFLDKGLKAEPCMRRVTFSFVERLTLIPVELSQLLKPVLWALLSVFLISGIGSNIFSFAAAWPRGLMATVAFAAGILAGGLIAPALLPWIPMRSFALKGAVTGFICGIGVISIFQAALQFWEALALILCTTAISSYLAMNFTGSTPFTSPSGVEKEMRKAIPLQVCAILIAVGAWIGSAFAK
jgi:hypothetical protein